MSHHKKQMGMLRKLQLSWVYNPRKWEINDDVAHCIGVGWMKVRLATGVLCDKVGSTEGVVVRLTLTMLHG